MSPDEIMRDFEPGDEHGWATEFAHLAVHHRKRLRHLQASIERHGIREPLLLGTDGRLWDGHHRLLIAVGVGMKNVPTTRAEGDEL